MQFIQTLDPKSNKLHENFNKIAIAQIANLQCQKTSFRNLEHSKLCLFFVFFNLLLLSPLVDCWENFALCKRHESDSFYAENAVRMAERLLQRHCNFRFYYSRLEREKLNFALK